MKRRDLIKQIREKQSFLCVGLDPDIEKLPHHLVEHEENPIYEFNKLIIEATAPYCIAFKPNTAFYEAYGQSGYEDLEKTVRYIKANYPDHFVIADAKRGDIGNTSAMYARAAFKRLNADAITVNPYMGGDSVKPFLGFENKWAIILGLTSNTGAADFEMLNTGGRELYMEVIQRCADWGTPDNMMFVVGATQSVQLNKIRQLIPEHFLLVPGVGAQGGDLADVYKNGSNKDVGLIVNASRSILYASVEKDFAEKAGIEAKKIAGEMAALLNGNLNRN